MDYVVVAKVVSTHGIKGDLKLYPLTDFAKTRFKNGKVFELYNEENKDTLLVHSTSLKMVGKFLAVHFEEITTPEQGIKYQKYVVRMDVNNLHHLPKDQYYYKDLLEAKVVLLDKVVGKVVNIESNGKQDLLRIRLENGKETLIVFVNAMIKDIDVKEKIVYLNDIEGLI